MKRKFTKKIKELNQKREKTNAKGKRINQILNRMKWKFSAYMICKLFNIQYFLKSCTFMIIYDFFNTQNNLLNNFF